MKKLLILLSIVGLCSCTQPTSVINTITQITTKDSINVLDSSWNLVPDNKLSRSIISARSAGYLDAVETAKDEYNASHIDDQWFLYIGDYPDLANAPPCNIYITDKVTHKIITYSDGVGGFITLKWENWPRAQMVENKAGWKIDAISQNGELYIDVIPPAPIIIIPTAEELYIMRSIYVVNSIGKIKFEEHCTISFVPADWPNHTLDTFYALRIQSYNLELNNTTDEYTPWRVIAGQLYSEPI